MPALFINLKIDQKEKFDLFKSTLPDIESLFEECHIKIRGQFAEDSIKIAKENFSDRANFYQNLPEKDWADCALKMLQSVKSRSIFFYLEDHKLVTSKQNLNLVLKNFDEYELDYLCYSFFRSSVLNTNNLLPLNPKHCSKFSYFLFNKENAKLIRKISPLYCIFTSASVCSTNYFKKVLLDENKKYKIYLGKLSTLLQHIFRYPKNRYVINFINFFLSFINVRLCIYPIDSPFNMEKLNVDINSFELDSMKNKFNFGVLKNELFANFDDDNNAYGESLIKRGLYPFEITKEVDTESHFHVCFTLNLKAGDFYDCTYYSQIHRIRKLPKLFIKINHGKLDVNYSNQVITLTKDSNIGFFTNMSPIINCIEDAEILISIYDECFDN